MDKRAQETWRPRLGKALLGPALAAALSWTAPAGAAPASAERHLVASGCSVSNLGYLSDLAADYERLAGVKMFVRGGGSVVGLEELAAGAVDLAASCRGKLREDPGDLEFVQVAWDALVFIVHPSNPVRTISFPEAVAVYQQTLRDWSQLGGPPGPIQLLLQRPSKGLSGVESSIRSQILDGKAPVKGASVVELASTGIVEQLVEKTPAGFGTSGFSSARRRQVKMLALNGVPPTRATIVDGTYPLHRPLYLIVRKPLQPEVKAFLDFALGPKGQELIGSYGAIPLRDLR